MSTLARGRLIAPTLTLLVVGALATPALAQRAPHELVGNASDAGGRHADLLAAHRCMDYAYTFGKGYLAADMKGKRGIPRAVLDAASVADGGSGAYTDAEFFGLPTHKAGRPSMWRAADVFGKDSKGFRLETFKRYGSPRGADPGTYNLTFIVASDDDQIFVCIQGTEPEIFPKGKARGNTMNNLKARPMVLKAFDPKATVHEGWARVALHYHGVMLPILKRHGLSKKKLTITGHSQGAVMAGYIGFQLARNKNLPSRRRHRIVTFAAPRYGTVSFVDRFRAVLASNAPYATVDALETVGDLVPGFWPFGQISVGKTWRAVPADVGYTDAGALDVGGHHALGISGYHAMKIIYTKGAYTGPSTVMDDVAGAAEATLQATCPKGWEKTAIECVSRTCPSGYVLEGGACVSACPKHTSRSGTGAHCMTRTKTLKKTTKKVWVGNLKKPRKYRKACPAGTSFSHDLAGYSYCTSSPSCPAHLPNRKGDVCHASCGPLKTDAFGNCVVVSTPRATRPHQCPAGTRREGPVCVK